MANQQYDRREFLKYLTAGAIGLSTLNGYIPGLNSPNNVYAAENTRVKEEYLNGKDLEAKLVEGKGIWTGIKPQANGKSPELNLKFYPIDKEGIGNYDEYNSGRTIDRGMHGFYAMDPNPKQGSKILLPESQFILWWGKEYEYFKKLLKTRKDNKEIENEFPKYIQLFKNENGSYSLISNQLTHYGLFTYKYEQSKDKTKK